MNLLSFIASLLYILHTVHTDGLNTAIACTTNMDYWRIIVSLCLIFREVYTDTTRTSRACYGAPGLLFTKHFINCSSTRRIYICDAYYTDNNVCGLTGLASSTMNLDRVTEGGYHRFKNIELVPLYNKCSSQAQCTYPAPRRGTTTFSVVKYQCIQNQTVPFFNKSELCQSMDEPHGNTSGAVDAPGGVGAAVGGVVAVLAMLFIVLATVWYLRKRRQNIDENENTSSNCQDQKAPSNISQSHYQETEDVKASVNSSDYDYATLDGAVTAHDKNAYLTIEPATKPTTNRTPATSTTEDDYDHIGDKPSALTSDYDTTASVAHTAGIGAHSREDDYGYNLLHKATGTKTVQNDYDTAASANKAVADLGRIDENTLSSPFDTAGKVRDGDYAVAGPIR